MKKVLSVFLTIILMASMISISPITVSASTADDIISIAKGQAGSYGSDTNKFTSWYYGKTTNAAWCAIFVSWCANQAGVLNDAIPKKASCISMLQWFKDRGEYYSVSSNYVPQKGDVIFFDTDGSGVTHHVEFVSQSGFITENGKTKVKCVGGNTSNSNFSGKDYVAEKKRYIYESSCKVMGYAHPSYGSESYTYSFNFNANGGTLGSTGAFTTTFGQEFHVRNTTCTRSGYEWAGWNVKRNNDNKWYVSGVGWCTESEIATNGYVKKIYGNNEYLTLDNSWTRGISGDGSYTFFAIWSKNQERETHISRWFSKSGSSDTAPTTTSGTTQERYYYWYKLYDYFTGDKLDTYSNSPYNVTINIYYSDGTVYKQYTDIYDNDENWISFVPQKADTYKFEVVLSGSWRGTFTNYITIDYDANLETSQDSVSLNLNGTNTNTIKFTPVGGFPGRCNVSCTIGDTSILSASWEGWSNGSIHLTVTGKKYGTTNLTISLFECYTGSDKIVDTVIIPVTVTANTYTITYNANGGSGAPPSQTKYYGTDIVLSSTVPERSGYTFKGWATNSSANSASYQPGSTFSSNADTTLYAVWEADATTLSVNSSNSATISTGGEMKYFTYTPSSSGTYVIYSTGSVDTRAYVYNSSGTQLSYNDDGGEDRNFRLEYDLTAGIKYTFGVQYYNSSTTGTINFKFGQVYNITYNANGGENAPETQKKDFGSAIEISRDEPTKEGYSFGGWSTSSTSTKIAYWGGMTYSAESNINLYAIWNKTITAVSVYTQPDKTTYYIGDSLNISGLKLKVTYSDGSTEYATSGYSTSGFSSNSAGTKTITVSYGGKTTTFTVTVNTPTISLSSTSKSMTVGDKATLTATTTPIGQSVTWISSNTSVAAVSNGTITAKAAGTVTITAKFTYGDYTYSKTCNVTVEAPAPILSSISVQTNPTKTSYYIGDSLNTSGLTLKLTYSDGSIETVASGFTTSGFSSTSAGTKTVTVSYDGKTTTFTVTVNTPTIVLSYTSESMTVGETATLTAATTPTGQAVTWASSDTSVATVSNGTITAKASGTATITAKFTYNDIIYSETCMVTVKENILIGDVNGDGIVDAGDAVIISRYDAGLITLTADQLIAGDVNGDGTVDAGDAVIISRYDAGLIDKM